MNEGNNTVAVANMYFRTSDCEIKYELKKAKVDNSKKVTTNRNKAIRVGEYDGVCKNVGANSANVLSKQGYFFFTNG